MKRAFKLLAYLKSDNTQIGQYDLTRVTSPSGIGFKQKVTVQETDTVDYVVSQVIKKKVIKLQVSFIEPDAYAQAENFQLWLGRYIDLNKYRLTLKYDNGLNERLVDVFIEDYELISLEAKIVSVQLSLSPLTPNYLPTKTTITIVNSTTNKAYPYVYPYYYGGGTFEGNKVTNNFIAAIPLIVIFRGRIVNPECTLFDDAGQAYATIKFAGMTLLENQKLVVDGINQRITFFTSEEATEGIDYFNEIDKTEDTFLRIKPGVSTIAVNLDSEEPSHPSVEISYVQYIV